VICENTATWDLLSSTISGKLKVIDNIYEQLTCEKCNNIKKNCSCVQQLVPNGKKLGAKSFPGNLLSKHVDKIKHIIHYKLGISEGKITPDAKLVDDLGADSLDAVELIMAFEDEFDIEIPDEDTTNIHTVNDIYEYLAKRI
jgi:acyl carrier protein